MVSVLKALMILKCKLYAEAELHRSTPQSLSGYLPIPLIACTSLSALRGYLARREATSEARTMMLTESGSNARPTTWLTVACVRTFIL